MAQKFHQKTVGGHAVRGKLGIRPSDIQSERRDSRLSELDREYRHQLTHLKKVAKDIRSRFREFNQIHNSTRDKTD